MDTINIFKGTVLILFNEHGFFLSLPVASIILGPRSKWWTPKKGNPNTHLGEHRPSTLLTVFYVEKIVVVVFGFLSDQLKNLPLTGTFWVDYGWWPLESFALQLLDEFWRPFFSSNFFWKQILFPDRKGIQFL